MRQLAQSGTNNFLPKIRYGNQYRSSYLATGHARRQALSVVIGNRLFLGAADGVVMLRNSHGLA